MEKQQKKVYLDLNHAFGSNFSTSINNQIGIIQQQQKFKIVYTVGKTVVKKTIDSDHMEFIKLSDNIQNIECMSISPTRNHIAVCQKIKNQNFLLLNLYGLKTRDSQIKHFKLPQTEKQSSFKIIAFSPSQPKYACCMTSQPQNQLMFLDISRSRGLAVSNFSVQGTQSLSICPTQSHLISCSGKNIFKLFKVEDYSFKALGGSEQGDTKGDVKKLPKSRNFTVHSWFDKTKILIGTDRGELFMVGPVGNNFEVKRHFNNVFGIQSPQQVGVTAICVFSKGFILGSNKGNFSLWIKKDQNQQNFEDEYTGDLVKKWKVPQSHIAQVSSIAMCPKQHHIAVSFKNNSIATTTFTILTSQQQGDYHAEENNNLSHQVLTFLYDGFHINGIQCMDVCIHRPIIATLSKKESTIRLWNYKKPNCQLIKKFDSKVDSIQQIAGLDMLNCLSLHPLGYYMAVGCCDKLRVYHILDKDLRNYRQIVLRGVCQLKFSNGGHLLAAAYPRQKYNIHQINIYNAYTLQQVARLSDHSNVITQLHWKFDDKFLYSVGIDGTVSQWKYCEVKNQNKQWACRKWTQNNSRYTSVIFQKTARSILVAGQQLNKTIIRQFKTEKDQIQKMFTMPFRINKLQWLMSQWNVPAILGGTQDGSLKVFNSVFDNIVQQNLNVHLKEITNIQTSPCGRYVFTTSKDGVIFIYQVSLTNKQGFVNKRLHDQVNDYQLNPLVSALDDELADIVLVQRNDVNQRIRYTKLLQKNLQDMKRKLIMQDDDENRKYEMELNRIAGEKQVKIDQLNEFLQKLKKEKKQLQSYFQSNFINVQNKNQKMLQDIQGLYQKKLALENKKYFQLQRQYENLHTTQQNQVKKLMNQSNLNIELLKKQFVDCFKKAQKVHMNQQDQIITSQKEFSEKVNQMEEEHQNQLKKISQSIQELQFQKNKKSGEYINNIESIRRQCRSLNDDIIHFMSQNEHLRQIANDLKNELFQINRNISNKKKELTDKQQNLKMRQNKIGMFQQRIGDLQKKKQVLSYRTWQMRQQIQPRQDQIQFLKAQIYNIQREFQNLLNDQKLIKQVQNNLKNQKIELNKQLQQQKNITKDKTHKVKQICDDINNVVGNKFIDKKAYQHQMKILLKKYLNYMTEAKLNNNNMKGFEEMSRHMVYLDKEINQVNKKTQTTIKKRDQEIQKATQQNADLIKEVAHFRMEKSKLLTELKNVQKLNDSLKRQTTQLKNLINSSNKPKQSQQSNILRKTGLKVVNQQISSTMALIRSSSQPLHKGKLAKGINYDVQSLSIFSKAKLKQLQSKLQMSKIKLRKKEMLVKVLKDKVLDHLKHEHDDEILERCVNQYEI